MGRKVSPAYTNSILCTWTHPNETNKFCEPSCELTEQHHDLTLRSLSQDNFQVRSYQVKAGLDRPHIAPSPVNEPQMSLIWRYPPGIYPWGKSLIYLSGLQVSPHTTVTTLEVYSLGTGMHSSYPLGLRV